MNPIDIRITGISLETEGFMGSNFALTPVGLMSFGFVNSCADIWSNSDIPITTTWTCGVPGDNVEVCVGD